MLSRIIVVVVVRDSICRKLWLSTVEGCVVLVNSTYNLSYLSPFCSSSPPSPPSPPPRVVFLLPSRSVVLFIFSSHSRSVSFARARILHLSPSSVFLLRSSSSSSFVWSERALHIYRYSSRGRVSAPLKKHNIYFSLSLTRSLTLSFSLSLPRNF